MGIRAIWSLLLILTACAEQDVVEPGDPFAPFGAPVQVEKNDDLRTGDRLMQAAEYELAIRAYYRAASEIGTTPRILTSLGSANLRLGRLGQAETLLRRSIAQDPSLIASWNNLGVVLMETGRTQEAARVFRKATALDSGKSDEIRGNLSEALAILNKPG